MIVASILNSITAWDFWMAARVAVAMLALAPLPKLNMDMALHGMAGKKH
jgi:hypothetical protein